jgi:hypothetical protein
MILPKSTPVKVAEVANQPVLSAEPIDRSKVTKKVRFAGWVALFNGWSVGLCAVLSLPFAFFSAEVLFVFIGLSVVAFNEFRGRRRVLSFDPSGARLLGWNQIGLLGVILVHCLWSIWVGLTKPVELPAELWQIPQAAEILGSPHEFQSLYRVLAVVVYVSCILASLLVQGLNAYYYFSRRKYVASLADAIGRAEEPSAGMPLDRPGQERQKAVVDRNHGLLPARHS